MRTVALRRILMVLLGTLLMLGLFGVPVAAQDTPDGTATPVAADTGEESVTNLPATGKGYGLDGTDTPKFAAEQMVITVLVLIAAGTLALGVIALAWRYDRQ